MMAYIPSKPVPEPVGDVRAQLAAALDPEHPKRACFLVPEDAARLTGKPPGVHVVIRSEGALVTAHKMLAELFRLAPAEPQAFDRSMATLLGLPEAKPDIDERCRGIPALCRAVQARDGEGHVVHEAVTSHLRFFDTVEAVQAHVPPGGQLAILHPAAALSRRVAMRQIDG